MRDLVALLSKHWEEGGVVGMVKAATENKDMIILPFICYIYLCFLFLYLSCFSVSSWNLPNESLATGNQDFPTSAPQYL